jgi:hypothetical protein
VKSREDELRTDWRSRWRSYVATAGVVALIVGVFVVGLRHIGHRTLPEPKTAPLGFSSEWTCGSNQSNHPLCWRDLPPATPRAETPRAP